MTQGESSDEEGQDREGQQECEDEKEVESEEKLDTESRMVDIEPVHIVDVNIFLASMKINRHLLFSNVKYFLDLRKSDKHYIRMYLCSCRQVRRAEALPLLHHHSNVP